MKKITMLHLSDAHMSIRHADVIAERISAVCAALSKEQLIPDLIVFTGDAAYSGKESEYQLFFERLVRPLLTSFSISPENFVIVPGNHDVDRDKIDSLQQAGLSNFISKPEEMDDIWRKVEQRSKLLSRQEAFANFTKQKKLTAVSRVVDVYDTSIGFACLNSAWLSASDNDKGNLVLSRAQFNDACQLVENADIKVALWHHPFACLHETDASRSKAQVLQRFHLCLNGHLHEEDGSITLSPEGRSQIFVCPALHAKGEKSGFMCYQIDMSERKLDIHAFRWNERKGLFVYNTDFSDNGQWSGKLLGQDSLSEKAIVAQRKTTALRQTQCAARLSRHLPPVVIGKREFSVEERFLEPYIITPSLPKPKRISSREIIHSKCSYIIEALPQAGKTALLDKIGLKLSQLGIVTAFARFSDLTGIERSKKGLISFLASTLNCSKVDSKNLLDCPITILLDDCDLRYDLPEWQLLTEWQSEQANLRVIATGRTTTLPQSREKVKNWKNLSIQPLPVSLVRKEVHRLEDLAGDQFQSSSNIQSTLTTLIDAELPRWPWVILLLFELAQKFQVSDVRSVEGILRKYADLRLGAFETSGTDRSATRARMLRLLATEMINSQVKCMTEKSVISIFDQEIASCGLEADGREILKELLYSQLLTRDESGVHFTFFILQEFFHAEYLRESLWSDVEQLDLDAVIQKSGALVFFAEMVKIPSLLKRCLEMTHSVKGSSSVSNLMESLANLKLSPVDPNAVVEIAKSAIPSDDEIEAIVSNAEVEQQGTRERRALSKPQSMEQLEQFIHGFSTSVAVMRGSRWLDKTLKQESIAQTLDLAISIVSEIAVDQNLLRTIATHAVESSLRRELAAVVNALLVLIVASMLAVLGAGQHLASTLREMFKAEQDDLKRLMLLMWYTEVGGTELKSMIEELVYNASHSFTVRLATMWLFSKFVMASSFSHVAKIDFEQLLRIAAEEQARRYSSSSKNKTAAFQLKAEADKIVQNARKLRDTHNFETEVFDASGHDGE
ncbi:MAG: metallophosphoesterase [Myxococcales bacterium]|nr:metallophosphoesterase [Myxococcales bacterium]